MIPNAPRMGDMPQGAAPIPEGVYYLRVEKSELKKGKGDKGTPYANLQLVVFGPEEAEEFHGRKVFDRLMLSGEGMFRTRQLLEASGADDDFILEDTDQLIDLEIAAAVIVRPEEVDPKTKQKYQARNEIARYTSIDAAGELASPEAADETEEEPEPVSAAPVARKGKR